MVRVMGIYMLRERGCATFGGRFFLLFCFSEINDGAS